MHCADESLSDMTSAGPVHKDSSLAAKIVETQAPDRQRWGNPESYKAEWSERARYAASLVSDNVSVLEIGVGTGVFGELVKGTTTFVGSDLQLLDTASTALDLDRDPLPGARFDYAVLLGVFGRLHQPELAAEKICNSADRVIVSYCCRRADLEPQAVIESRRRHGWVNSFDRTEFIRLFSRRGHELFSSVLLRATDEIEEFLMEFRRLDIATRQTSGERALVCDQGNAPSPRDAAITGLTPS
jgi:hypothetical protein